MTTLFRKEIGATAGLPVKLFPDHESAMAHLTTELQKFAKSGLNKEQAKWWARNDESGANVEYWIG